MSINAHEFFINIFDNSRSFMAIRVRRESQSVYSVQSVVGKTIRSIRQIRCGKRLRLDGVVWRDGLRGGTGLLQRGREVKHLGSQFAGGTGTELHALDVGGGGEVVLAVGTATVLDADGEDGEVGNLHVLAL